MLERLPTRLEREPVVGDGEGGDETTAIDQAAELAVVERLDALGGDFTLVSEELGHRAAAGDSAVTVVLDPIDGSINAKRGIPFFSLSIAVADGPTMRDVQFGYVYDFGAGEEWAAVLGEGATLDGAPLDAPPPKETIELLGLEATKTQLVAERAPSLVGVAERLRIMGSLALSLCHFAAGRVDAVCSLRPARSVDIAAAQLVVRERGLIVELCDGGALLDAPLDLGQRSRVAAAATPDGIRAPRRRAALTYDSDSCAVRLRMFLAVLGLALVPVALAATGWRVTLKAPAANPKVNVKWYYSITAKDLKGRALKATVTATLTDPIGSVHPDRLRAVEARETDHELALQGHVPRLHHVPPGIAGIPTHAALGRESEARWEGADEGAHAQGHAEVTEGGGVAVAVDHVSKAFDNGAIEALDDVSLALEPGDFVSVVGPSGCGKSTLLNLIGALDRPDAGTIRVGGAELDELRDAAEYRAATVGFVFQFHHLIATLNAARERPGADDRARVCRVTRALRRRTSCSTPARSPSARELARRRSPAASASALRSRGRSRTTRSSCSRTSRPARSTLRPARQIVDLLHRLRDERGMTILLVTNDAEVAAAADRTLRIRDGRIETDAVTPAAAPRSA